MVWSSSDDFVLPLITFVISGLHSFSYLATAILNPGIAYSKDFESRFLSKNLNEEEK